MASPASIAKHPIHPMLAALPIGLWIFSLVSDVIYVMKWGSSIWNDVAFYTMAGGIVGALLAAVPGFVDLLSMSKGKIKTIALWHMSINLTIVVLYGANLWLRTTNIPGARLPTALSLVGVIMLGISGWLGGEMVYVHGMAVEPQQHILPDAAPQGRATPRRVA
ncbi:MAG TPA: DUF2231 domain-containing protein [Blastocatellia bacterium]|nr:DUF2231 domain-containing protein [Blastocatellia bacterium]